MSLSCVHTKTPLKEINIDIVHPDTGIPIGVTITIWASCAALFLGVSPKQVRYIEGAKSPSGKVEPGALNFLATVTKSWCTGERAEIEITPGKWLKYTPENAKRLYGDPRFSWVMMQVFRKIRDDTDIMQKADKSRSARVGKKSGGRSTPTRRRK